MTLILHILKFLDVQTLMFYNIVADLHSLACDVFNLTIVVFGCLTPFLNNLLFFFRIRAVFYGNNVVIWIFVVLLFVVFASSLIGPFMFRNFMTFSPGCDVDAQPNASDGLIAALIYDTLVFMFITMKLLRDIPGTYSGILGRFKAFSGGEGAGRVTTILLHSGQQCYL